MKVSPFVRIKAEIVHLQEGAKIGRWSRIDAQRFSMGKDSVLQPHVTISCQRHTEATNCSIGDQAVVFRDTWLDYTEGLSIGKRVGIGGRSCIWTHGGWELAGHPMRYASVTIEDDAWLAWEVTVNPGVTIGEGSEVWSKSMVTKDVPPHTAVAGNPAKVVKSLV